MRHSLWIIWQDMQALWSTTINRFSQIMIKHGDTTKRQYEVLQRYNENTLRAVEDIDVESDQALYCDYNKRPFFPPPEFTFEPCAIWHDNVRLSASSAAEGLD